MSDTEILAARIKPEQHLQDQRAIHDIANLRMEVKKDPGQSWSVLRITPEPHSGSATLIGAALDGKTGQIIDAGTGRPVTPGTMQAGMIEEGSWELLTRLGSPRGKQRGHYKWMEPLESNKRQLGPKDLYRPFAQGGVVLSLHNPKVEGAAQFASVHLLPVGWESYVRPAFEAFQKNKALFTGPSSSSRDDLLKEMVKSDNSILSVIAFRTLAETGKMDLETLRTHLAQSKGYRRAAFTYLALLNPQPVGEATLDQEFARVIEGTRRSPEHRAVAVGLATATLLHPESHAARSLGPKYLSRIRSHSARLLGKSKSDAYLGRIFETLRVA